MIRNITIARRAPAYGGKSFGATGPYELLDGHIEGSLDPDDPANAGIVDLDLAPRDSDGRVPYRCDLVILRPADPGRGNGWLLYDIVNRGLERVLSRVNGVAVARRPGTGDDCGDGLLMREGFTFVWSGWQPDLPNTGEYLTASYPIAMKDNVPVTGLTREEWVDTGTADPFHPPLTYPTADAHRAKATLTVRACEQDQRSTPDDLTWSYVDEKTLRIDRPAGFDSGAIYEFIYPATQSPIAGMAFAAVHDVVSFLRFETSDEEGNDNPLAAGGTLPRRAMLFGVSQSGRFARDFLWQGYNQDRRGRQLFDAAVVVVAGSRKTWVNGRFAQPGRFSRQHEDHSFPGDQFPFAYAPVRDPATGESDDILRRCREQGAVPHLIHFDSECEMWSARASLLVDDGAGNGLDIPDNVRLYLAAGMPHAPGLPPFPGMTQQPVNPLNYSPLLRPLVLALRRWVDDGTPPPDNRFPTADKLATLDQFRQDFPAIPGVATPERLNEFRRQDHTQVPPVSGEAWPVHAPRVDEDGNPLAGILHPFVDVPLGSFTGWNLRAAGHGLGDLCSVYGAFVPFAVSEAERRAAGDPRLSLAERYGNHDIYRELVAQSVAQSVAQGYLLDEDGTKILALADEMAAVFTGQVPAAEMLWRTSQ